MSKRGLGLLLVLSFAVGVAATVQDFRFDLSTIQHQAAAATLDRASGSLDIAMANLRAAQAGYVAAGQGPDFWMKRASEISSDVETRLMSLQAASTSEPARTHYDAALAALASLASLDKKARAALQSGERLQASDLIFMDSAEPAQRLGAEVQAARDAELDAASTALALTRKYRLAMNGAALALLFLSAVWMFRRVRVAAPEVIAAPVLDLAIRPAEDRTLRDAPPSHAISLRDAAEVCVDLARVLDGRDVQPLLARAAGVLDAKGLILWVVDGTGEMLQPSVAHGYSDAVLKRLGSLPTAADNPTSLAFRSMQAQVIPSPAVGLTGAIAAPLITASGCVGVLAAEVKKGTPSHETLAVSRMFAAQLATFITPAASATQQAAQA
jgi:hypothetical protein